MAKIIEVIANTTVIGDGTKKNPVRLVEELWTKDGKCICTIDPTGETNYLAQTIDLDKIG